MRERYLFLKKEITRFRDMFEHLPLSYREKLKEYEEEYDLLKESILEEDLRWADEEFSRWYERYMVYEVMTTIRLSEG
ncbi:hypothetical protein LF845_02750 [Deferribacterales bacterium Es71-Z0220]|jgi:hypothetical protein|uniref:hypothetical protein n=1 Tax=Deferrivibrio essentukiensis TaxID=2880922 RepID=UPI001F600FFD|nr:hypothetical protein [Deferrivibrio essentukiensis]MBZ4642633.1 hypothetical protein [Deferribacteraceae bacterium]MCB4203878.1 hypothetical protein [Deferrivibrio essentukiensis]